jgi:hypothetical protein
MIGEGRIAKGEIANKIGEGRAKGYSLLPFAISLPATARMRRDRADERHRAENVIATEIHLERHGLVAATRVHVPMPH